MKKNFLTFIAAACAAGLCLQISVSGRQQAPDDSDIYTGGFEWYPDLPYDELNNYILGEDMSFIDNGYDVVISSRYDIGFRRAWNMTYIDALDGYSIYFEPYRTDLKIKIPDSLNIRDTGVMYLKDTQVLLKSRLLKGAAALRNLT